MSPHLSLQTIAREKNWMEFALLLEAAMTCFEAYGQADANAVRAAIGRMRRQLPSSLTTALKAMRFLRTRHPNVLATRDARIGCAHVRVLSRIEALSPKAAALLAPKVFSRAIRHADLLAQFSALRQQTHNRERVALAA